jgi:hypothetical protein
VGAQVSLAGQVRLVSQLASGELDCRWLELDVGRMTRGLRRSPVIGGELGAIVQWWRCSVEGGQLDLQDKAVLTGALGRYLAYTRGAGHDLVERVRVELSR